MLTLGLNAMCQSVKSPIHFVPFVRDKCGGGAHERTTEVEPKKKKHRDAATLYADNVLRISKYARPGTLWIFMKTLQQW